MERDTEAIAIPRTPGSPGHARVRAYIERALVGWSVQTQTVRVRWRGEDLVFRNVVATLELRAEVASTIVLAAHYDSKRGLGPDYTAATDSATSCAILLSLARDLKDLEAAEGDLGRIRLVFFDGEEALEEPWTRSNAMWGSRALAWHWAETGEIRNIRLLVLLDLVGTGKTQFYSFWSRTEADFRALAAIDDSGMFQEGPPPVAAIDDDHLPFLRRGVPILHLISVPFPDEWHTVRDTTAIVDYKLMARLAAALTIYIRRMATGSL